MTKQKRTIAACIAPVMAGCILLVLAFLPSEPGVTRNNYHRVRVGISKSDVESIFGSTAEETASAAATSRGVGTLFT